MAKIKLEVENHRLEMMHSSWNGIASISVDGETVFTRSRKKYDNGFVCRFEVAEIPYVIKVINDGLTYRYEFLSGENAASIRESKETPITRIYLIRFWLGTFIIALAIWIILFPYISLIGQILFSV